MVCLEDNKQDLPFEVIITTRNRWGELFQTIQQLISIGIQENFIYIIDDASIENNAEVLLSKFPEINIKVLSSSNGLIKNRNTLTDWTTAPYILSLDDDSHILSMEDLNEALHILKTHPEFGVFCFRPFEQLEIPPPKKELPSELKKIKSFIGCGYLMKRSVWNQVGPFWPPFEFYCEEIDFSLRAFKLGYYIVTKTDLVVHHRIDWKTRNRQFDNELSKGIYGAVWRSMLGFSNHLLISTMHNPPMIRVIIQIVQIAKRFFYYFLLRKDYKGFIYGLKRFFKMRLKAKEQRQPLSFSKYLEYQRLGSY